MNLYVDTNPNEMLLGMYFTNGETELGEEVKIFAVGLVFFTINLAFNQ